jgi:hypothetical protein
LGAQPRTRPSQSLKQSSGDHREYEDHGTGLPARQRDDGGPRAEAAEPPTDAEDHRADHEAAVDGGSTIGQTERFAKEGGRPAPCHAESDRRDGYGSDHDEREARIPCPEDVEERQDPLRPRHAGETQADGEEEAGGEGRKSASHR